MSEMITTADLLEAYRHGFFPMAESRHSVDIFWYDPPLRGQLSIDNLHVPARLRRTILKHPYDVKINTAFDAVIKACAETRRRTQPGRLSDTWINDTIIDLFCALHREGYAHSVECWKDGKLAGGLYGVAIGGAFFGESMFSTQPNASKIALVHLCARLKKAGFTLLDTQFVNEHLRQFGAFEISRDDYRKRLAAALPLKADFLLRRNPPKEQDLVESYLAKNRIL